MQHPAAHLSLTPQAAATPRVVIEIAGASKTYRTRDGDVPSLRPLDFTINDGAGDTLRPRLQALGPIWIASSSWIVAARPAARCSACPATSPLWMPP